MEKYLLRLLPLVGGDLIHRAPRKELCAHEAEHVCAPGRAAE